MDDTLEDLLMSHLTVGLAVVGLSNNVPDRLRSSSVGPVGWYDIWYFFCSQAWLFFGTSNSTRKCWSGSAQKGCMSSKSRFG